jgi:hypothetical protein
MVDVDQVGPGLAHNAGHTVSQEPITQYRTETPGWCKMPVDGPVDRYALRCFPVQTLASTTSPAEDGHVMAILVLSQGQGAGIVFGTPHVFGKVLVEDMKDTHG